PTRRARGIRPVGPRGRGFDQRFDAGDRKSTRLNSSHPSISYAVFCLQKNSIRCPKSFSLIIPVKRRRPILASTPPRNSRLYFFFKEGPPTGFPLFPPPRPLPD